MAGAASQAGDADCSRAPGLTSGLQGSVCPPLCSIVGAIVTSDSASVLLYLSLVDWEGWSAVHFPLRQT